MTLNDDHYELLTAIVGDPNALMTHWFPDSLAGPAMQAMIVDQVIVPAPGTGWRVTYYGERLMAAYKTLVDIGREARRG